MVVVIGVIGAVVVLSRSPKPKPPKTATVLLEAQDLTFSQKYAQAIQILRNQLQFAQNKTEKAQIYLAIGVAYENENQQASAYSAYLRADQDLPSYGIDQAVARTAAASGNRSVAISYYQKCITMIQGGQAPHNAGDLPELQVNLQNLESSQ